MKRRQKAGFVKPDKLQNHSNEGKGKEKNKERGEGKEEKKKSNGCTLSCYNGYFGDTLAEKNCWTEKVHLAITFSKIRLDGPRGTLPYKGCIGMEQLKQ